MNLGVIGLSAGNGHPYSWSAIFNGYDPVVMAECPFPVIPQYLAAQVYPADFLTAHHVTHVWTQDPAVSQHVAAASRIPHVVADYHEMLGAVDAVLLARDDAEHHWQYAAPFLHAGVPVYVDKPLGRTRAEAQRLLDAQQYDWQVFSCSALRYAPELQLPAHVAAEIGPVQFVDALTPKYWDTYAVHLIEPLVASNPNLEPTNLHTWQVGSVQSLQFTAGGTAYRITATGSIGAPMCITYHGVGGFYTTGTVSAFHCFRAALAAFVEGIRTQKRMIPLDETLRVVSLIETGRA